ncbi:MAG: hypothetical protein WC804_14345 [Sphingomonas sp.]|uniref:hypothetical protein n=1 Tax=Sphingomonas sp. TaxID=28214 RepID=UPI0035676F5D
MKGRQRPAPQTALAIEEAAVDCIAFARGVTVLPIDPHLLYDYDDGAQRMAIAIVCDLPGAKLNRLP